MARTKFPPGPNAPKRTSITPEAVINNARPNTRKKYEPVKGAPGKSLDALPPSKASMKQYTNFPTKSLRDKYQMVSERPIIQGRKIDNDTLETLGIKDEVDHLISEIGWEAFFFNDCPAFVELTREFYTTFEFIAPENFSLDTPGVIRYRLMGHCMKQSITDFNKSLGFVFDDEVVSDWYVNSKVGYGDFQSSKIWGEMSVGNHAYDPSQSPSTLLKKIEWQYLQRLLSFNYIARKSGSTTCSKVELYVIWAMANGVKLNLGYWVAIQIRNVLEKKKGLIFGSLITKLAINLGFLEPQNHTLHIDHEPKPLDGDTLIRMGIVEMKDGGLVFVQPSLPLRAKTLRVKLKRARTEEPDNLDNREALDEYDLNSFMTNVMQKFDEVAEHMKIRADQIAEEMKQKVDQIAKDMAQKFDDMAKGVLLHVEQIAIMQNKMSVFLDSHKVADRTDGGR